MKKFLKKLLGVVMANREVTEDVALALGTFGVSLGVSGHVDGAAIQGAAVGAGKAVLRVAVGQVVGWAMAHGFRAPVPVAATTGGPGGLPTPPTAGQVAS